MSNKLGVKVKFGKQCRRFRISDTMKLSEFNGRLEALFSTKLYNTQIKYQDDDGDWVNVDTEEEFNEAKLLTLSSKTKILRLVVSKSVELGNGKKEKTDLEKFVLSVVEQSGRVLDTKSLETLYKELNKSVKGDGNSQKNLGKFVEEIGSLLSELAVSFGTSEISNQMKQEFSVDINKKSGEVKVNVGGLGKLSKKPSAIVVKKPKVLGASFIEDVSITSDTEIEQATLFKKIWKVKNTGDCDWGKGVHLKYIGGSDGFELPKDSKFQLSKYAKVGEKVDIVVELTAPKEADSYSAYFSLVSADGKLFGQKLLLELNVIENKKMKKWGEKLKFLAEMGFLDTKKLVDLLEKNNGDLPSTIQDHLSTS